MRPLSAVLIVVLAAAACGEPATDSSPSIEIRPAAAYAALPAATLEPDGPLCADASPCLPPTQPVAAVSERGDVLLLALGGRRPEVVRVPSAGGPPTAVGREGSGPGEYRIPALLGFTADGDGLVFDVMARRVLRYAPDGTPLATSVVLLPASPHPAFGLVHGELWILASDEPTTPGDSMPVVVFALDSGAAAPRRLQTLAFRLPAFPIGEFRVAPTLLAPQDFFAFRADSSVVVARGGLLGVDIHAPSGALIRRIGFAVAARATTPEEIAEEAKWRVRGIPDPQARAAIAQDLSANAAARLPVLTGLVAMADGELWLRGTPSPDGDSVEWLVLQADGEPLRRVTMRADDALLGKHGGRYLVMRTDDEGGRYWWMTLR